MTQHLVLPIADFGCVASGALILERALARTPGVSYVYVNPSTEMAYIDFDPTQCDRARLVQAIRAAGFFVADSATPQHNHHASH